MGAMPLVRPAHKELKRAGLHRGHHRNEMGRNTGNSGPFFGGAKGADLRAGEISNFKASYLARESANHFHNSRVRASPPPARL
jgi:hypothetical protein